MQVPVRCMNIAEDLVIGPVNRKTSMIPLLHPVHISSKPDLLFSSNWGPSGSVVLKKGMDWKSENVL